MAENKIDMQIGLGVEYDATGIEEANADLEQLGATKEVLVTRTNEVAAADAKEQKAMQLATKSRNELIKTLKRLQRELKAAAEAQDVEKYRAVEQEIAETRSAFEKQNQVLELNNIQLGQQAQNGIMVANTLTGLAKGLQDGSLSAGDFANGILSICTAIKAGLGPIGWLMLAIQGLQAAWDYFSKEAEKDKEAIKMREDNMKNLADITDAARRGLEAYNRTKLQDQHLGKIRGTYAAINRELERQIKNIQLATDAELARLAITQDEQEHKRTMKRAKLGRQLAAGTITQEEYEQALFDMKQSTQREGLDAEVSAKETALKDAEAKLAARDAAWDELMKTSSRVGAKLRKFRKYDEGLLAQIKDEHTALEKEYDAAHDALKSARLEGKSWEVISAAQDRLEAAETELWRADAKVAKAYDTVHGEGAFEASGMDYSTAIEDLYNSRRDVDAQAKAVKDAEKAHRDGSTPFYEAVAAAKRELAAAEEKRSRELGQMADEREENEKDRALQKLLAEKQKAAAELAKMETAELKRRQKDAQKRANAAREAGDADGAAVLEKLAALYKDELAQRRAAAKAKGAVDAARNKAEAAAPAQDKRTDEVLREAEQLANRIAKGEALDGRSAEQLLALWKQAQASKDKKDDAFVAQLIQLMQLQADVGAGLQSEVRKLKRKTEKLTSRNFD